MYPVSEAYLEAIQQRSVETRWYGYIRSKIGMSYYYDISSIVEGSGKVTRQSYYDINGEPAMSTAGYAAIETEYNSTG